MTGMLQGVVRPFDPIRCGSAGCRRPMQTVSDEEVSPPLILGLMLPITSGPTWIHLVLGPGGGIVEPPAETGVVQS